MQIELKGVLKTDIGRDRVALDLEGTISLDELKAMLGIDPGIPVVACIGKNHLKSTYQFDNSDSVALLPVVAGG